MPNKVSALGECGGRQNRIGKYGRHAGSGFFRAALWCCLLLVLLVLPYVSYAQTPRVVKVGYFKLDNYFRVDDQGRIQSYDAEFLQMLAPYTGLKFEFVDCGTWDQALEMLKAHKVELIGTAQWTMEREKQYAYCQENYGYTVGELVALPASPLIFQDYPAIGLSTLGCSQNYVRRRELDMLLRQHKLSPKIVTYPNENALIEGLETGKVDLIAVNSHLVKPDWKVIDKFSLTPFYFISWLGNEALIQVIDNSIIRMKLEQPNLTTQLLQKHLPGITLVPLSKPEIELVNRKVEYTILLDKGVRPLLWYDKQQQAVRGSFAEAIRQLADFTGLKLQILPPSRSQGQPAAQTVFTATLVPEYPGKKARDTGVTAPILKGTFNLFQHPGKAHDLDLHRDHYTIAIVAERDDLQDYLQARFPKSKIVTYASPRECLQKLEADQVDFAFLNLHAANNALLAVGLDDIREMPLKSVDIGFGLRFQGPDKEILAGIINKGIDHLDLEEINKAMMQAALSTKPELTFKSFTKTHPDLTLGLSVLGIIVLLGIAVSITYAQVMRRERDKVRRANRDRSEFFARMSHDMRTPMNGILGMAYLSEQEQDAGVLRRNMAKIKGSGQYLLRLINDTLDWQKLELGHLQLEMQVVQAQALLDNIENMVQITAANKGVEFLVENKNIDLHRYVKCDPQRLQQILVNLLSNAVKFTPAGGQVRLILERTAGTGNLAHVKIQVVDTGMGISRKFLQNQLFTPYTQEANELSSQYAGTGLGLAIVKSLVTLMQGRIEVVSELGEGSTFTIYLDLNLVSQAEGELSASKQVQTGLTTLQALQGKRILLCEDHPVNAEITKKLLEKVGCQVEVAENGQAGVDIFAASAPFTFAAVLMDIRMPVLDGIGAAHAIRYLRRQDAGKVPIIALSANAYQEDVKKSIAAGMNDHIAKPVTPHNLYGTLLRYVQ